MNWPGRKQLPDPPGAVGTEVKADTSRTGVIDNGLVAFEERIAVCSKYWPRARLEDFEQLDRRGRHWVDKATGTTYRREHGCTALLSPTIESVDTWLVANGEIVLLVRADRPQVATVIHGRYGGGEIRDGVIHWEQRP